MSNRPTFIDYASPDSERSIYFDAPIMHIFSKKSSDDAGFVAPSPKRNSRIRSTTSLKSLRDGNEDAQPTEGAVPDQPASDAQPIPGDYEESGQHEEPQSTLRSTDFATSGLVASDSMGKKGNSHKHREGSTSTDPMSDSGYDSAGSPRNQPRSLRNSTEMQPIPVVWAEGAGPAPEDNDEQTQPRSKSALSSADPKRSHSMRSFRSGSMLRDRDGQDSIRTTQSGRRRRLSLTGGSFASGAGTIGPASRPQDDETQLFRSRSVSAEASLTKKQKLKIGKAECEYSLSPSMHNRS